MPKAHAWAPVRIARPIRQDSIYVPGELSVAEAHAHSDRVEAAIREALGEAEVLCHVEPHEPR